MLAILSAFVATDLRSGNGGMLAGFASLFGCAMIVTLKNGTSRGAGIVVSTVLIGVCIGLVCAAYYLFSPAHRTYSSLAPALLFFYYAILPWVAPRFFKLVRRVYERTVIDLYQPPPMDESCGPIGWRGFDEVAINARGDG
jgi:hypothetical protein